MRNLIVATLLCFALISVSAAQKQENPVFKGQVNLATVSFRHIAKGKTTELRQEDVLLLEDGKPQRCTFFEGGSATQRTSPIEITWLVDRISVKPWAIGSPGHRNGMDASAFHAGLIALLEKYPTAFHSIYGFDTELWRFCGPTHDSKEITRAVQNLVDDRPAANQVKLTLPSGSKQIKSPSLQVRGKAGSEDNWLYESIGASLQDLATVPSNATRMLVVVSFGNRGTDTKPSFAAEIARELGVPIYPIVLEYTQLERASMQAQQDQSSGDPYKDSASRINYAENALLVKRQFASLGEMTGGQEFLFEQFAKQGMDLVLRVLDDHVQHQYTVGFSPKLSEGTPQRHTLEVKLTTNGKGKIAGGKRIITY